MAGSILIAGTHTGVGKTVVAVGIAGALAKRGLKVQAFKIGPDGLDAGFLAQATGRPCPNLDLWLMPKRAVLEIYERQARGTDICVIEGMLGLYDGMGMKGQAVSTADVNGVLGAPVLLVVDSSSMVESAAAVIHGFATFGEVPVRAAVFTRVGERHFQVLKRAVEVEGDIRAAGYLPPGDWPPLPDRRAGLVSASEAGAADLVPRLATWAEQCVDLDRLVRLAAEAPGPAAGAEEIAAAPPKVRIAVARDAAFHFYYEENLRLLRQAGAELVEFSPLKDETLPEGAAGLYLGGGFADGHGERLEANRPMREAVRSVAEAGMPIYAESGGTAYLGTHLVGRGVRAWEMAGVIPGELTTGANQAVFGYAQAGVQRDTFLAKAGETLRGHEFRAGSWSARDASPVYSVSRPGREDGRPEGHGAGNVHASFVHVHFSYHPELASRFVEAAAAFESTRAVAVGAPEGRKKGRKKKGGAKAKKPRKSK